MNKWKPITDAEFKELFEKQYAELNVAEREQFKTIRVPQFKAVVKRSTAYGDENVYVVSKLDDGVLYFDDVEWGFNISRIDSNGIILDPGGSQNTLKEAIQQCLPRIKKA